jgi:hypothetical protein
MMTIPREALAAVIGGVIRQTLADSRAAGLVVLEAATPEGRLLVDIAVSSIGRDRVHQARPAGSGEASLAEREEMERMTARIAARARSFMVAHPANKTILLLGPSLPPESLLPLGDLYASDVRALMGGATLSEDVRAIADSAGGLDRLDGALAAWLEGRRSLEDALAALPETVRAAIRTRLAAKQPERRWPRCVPKLGGRTLWIDLFE